jgi:translation initiation factor IF-3
VNKSLPDIKFNRYIYSSSGFVKVIEKEGSFVGEMHLNDALNLAYDQHLDLVQISYEKIPVCKICDYSKYKYELAKKNKEKTHSNKNTQLKVLKLSLNIGKKDLEQRVKQCGEFIEKSHDVQFILRLKGRENNKPELAIVFFNEIKASFPESWHIKKEPSHSGKEVLMIISKKN